MTRAEIITHLCDIVADITNIRENELKDEDWMVDASLRFARSQSESNLL